MRSLALLLTALPLLACGPEHLEDISYDDRFGDATTLDVWLPDGAPNGQRRPAVMFIHGGGWTSGSKAHFRRGGPRLASSGYVAVSIDYRLMPDAVFPDPVHDAMCALSFLRNNAADYDIDPARIAVMGYSAGAHLAGLVGAGADHPAFEPDCANGPTGAPAAVIPGSGPLDLSIRTDVKRVQEFVGATFEEDPQRWTLASPISHVDPSDPPFLLIHGEQDWLARPLHSKRMRQALDAAGVEARFLLVEGGGHLVNPEPDGDLGVRVSIETPEAWLAIGDFLRDTIGEP